MAADHTTLTDRHLPRPDHPVGGFGRALSRENADIAGSADHGPAAPEIRGSRYSTPSDEHCDPTHTLRHGRRQSTARGGTGPSTGSSLQRRTAAGGTRRTDAHPAG